MLVTSRTAYKLRPIADSANLPTLLRCSGVRLVLPPIAERYQQWLAEKQAAGMTFTADQQKWLDAIKDHIASSLNIEQDDFEGVPFHDFWGLGRAYELFGESLLKREGEELEAHYRHILEELGKLGMLGEIFKKARPEIQNPATLRRLIVD